MLSKSENAVTLGDDSITLSDVCVMISMLSVVLELPSPPSKSWEDPR